MKRQINKAISFVLSLSMAVVGSVIPVFADTSYGPGDTGSITVTAEINSTYTIELPATVELKPISNYAEQYRVYIVINGSEDEICGFGNRAEAENYLNTHYMACDKNEDPEDIDNWDYDYESMAEVLEDYDSNDYIVRMSEKCEIRSEIGGSFWFESYYNFYITGLFLKNNEAIAVNAEPGWPLLRDNQHFEMKNIADPTKYFFGQNSLNEYFYFCSNASDLSVKYYDDDDRLITQDVSRYSKKLDGNDGSASSRTEGNGYIKIELRDSMVAGSYSGTAEFDWTLFETDNF